MNNLSQIIQKYNLRPNKYDGQFPDDIHGLPQEQVKRYNELEAKWKHKIPKDWYGFNLTCGLPLSWYNAIDEALDWVNEKTNGDFEIHQIKIKFGGLRFYVAGNLTHEDHAQIRLFEEALYSDLLVY